MYPFKEIEEKWRKKWEELELFKTPTLPKNKYYIMEMWPYTSGNIHMGHFRNYCFGDLRWRWEKMKKKDLLHPFGWDAFGLPAEEAAIKRNISPKKWTYDNIETAKRTIKKIGLSYDWEREIATSDPQYYKWTQWLLIQLYKEGLLYRDEAYVNWCPGCKTVLANEQVESGKCWRCHSEVGKRKLTQWFIKITEYAEELYWDIDKLEHWPENIKEMQRNWIGRKEGAEIKFHLENGEEFKVFTTRPDTIFGVTFMCISPESKLAEKIAEKNEEVEKYIKESLLLSNIERTREDREKTGVDTGVKVIHPLTGEKLPVFVADFVLGSYGTGLVMCVPAHDQRDFEFARKYNLPIKEVIKGPTPLADKAYTDPGTLINSQMFNGMNSIEASNKIIEYLESKGLGYKSVNYRLKDWLISRQRYWGAPIPMIHCERCGVVPVPEENLPVLLPPPEEVDFIPKARSPLASHPSFGKVECPKCRGKAKRDPDTADTFVDSAWYHFRYLDPRNEREIFDKKEAEKWLPVDLYIGGAEHATGHLIYMRFFTKFLYKLGYSPVNEPVVRLFNQGMVRDEKGEVMSKSKGNVVDPEALIDRVGIDAARVAMFFFGPPQCDIDWKEKDIKGSTRFLTRLYELGVKDLNKKEIRLSESDKEELLYKETEKTTKKVTEDIENFSYNTAIAALMEFLNTILSYKKKDDLFQYALRRFFLLLSPIAPYISEEMYCRFGDKESVFFEDWPSFDPKGIIEDKYILVVQINGKVRGRIEVKKGINKDEAFAIAKEHPNVRRFLDTDKPKKIIFIEDKLLNIVI
ncbi:MAG: leucine--tRNA ligase [candidate division WOR-3 bacterium]